MSRPAYITHDQLRQACEALGVDANRTYEFHADLDRIVVGQYAHNPEGRIYLDQTGEVAREVTTIPVGAPPTMEQTLADIDTAVEAWEMVDDMLALPQALAAYRRAVKRARMRYLHASYSAKKRGWR